MTRTKVCNKCDIEQPIDSFYCDAKNRDGYVNWCKNCSKYIARLWFLANKQRRADCDRAYRATRPIALAVFRQTDAERRKGKSRGAISSAIRGKKVKPLPCEWCATVPTEAHHPDYSRPLDVMWLCKKHHMDLHRANNDLKRSA